MVLFEQRGERRGKIGADDYSGIEFACKYGAKRGKLCTPKAFRRARCVRLFIIMGSDVTAVSAVLLQCSRVCPRAEVAFNDSEKSGAAAATRITPHLPAHLCVFCLCLHARVQEIKF